ncbi:hypothetical protein N7520_007589 [Penicillium odoratum]|uniref:uncharacterized protein n=1 Tax=Penicillium odoratum TaxID=1167516 RepID=UPI00254932BC|nr:uncharacterized protein N7520_007589 [Penicillium odoratum]KAJ5760433.1 hypothetical protein N7520_007589 [Penicillium odoratum]
MDTPIWKRKRIDHRSRGVLVSIRPQFVLSLFPSTIRDVLESGCGGYEVEGLRLNEPGEDGADDPGVVLAVADADVAPMRIEAAAAAAAGLQRAQIKMLKPRPSQIVQIEPLEK